ncbi:hypothetical protein [Chitinibacter sp. GC72]|uniref:hypothetical protein n=1 Tax=Chitinibacter sp. GC72 TaxID=1526917 RepID=UPI0012FBCE38|nr:hypothetical protein [Chitinibacter sp. GC72]
MHTHLVAPSQLIPLISARLAFHPPAHSYSLHPLSSQLQGIASDAQVLIVQAPDEQYVHRLQASYPDLLDLLLVPSPIAPSHGFITLASGSNAQLARASSLIDHLAPIHNGWLHIGPLGSCGYINQLWHALLTPRGTPPFLDWTLQSGVNTQSKALDHTRIQADLIAQLASLMAQQQLQIQTMASISRRFLADYPEEAFIPHHPQTSNLFGVFAASNQAPAEQLARLLAQY